MSHSAEPVRVTRTPFGPAGHPGESRPAPGHRPLSLCRVAVHGALLRPPEAESNWSTMTADQQPPAPGDAYTPAPSSTNEQAYGAVLVPAAIVYTTSCSTTGYGEQETHTTSLGGFLSVLLHLAAAGVWGWNRWYRQGRTGAPLGKQIVGIRLG